MKGVPPCRKAGVNMEDAGIVELYWSRSESAITETMAKYGKYCYSIAFNILSDDGDARESVNDTYLEAWNSIPPHRPAVLSTFLRKLTRRLSIDRWRAKTAGKRGGGEIALALEELRDCIPSAEDVELRIEAAELGELIDRFVRALPAAERRVFICKYWYLDPIPAISRRFGFSVSRVKSMLLRTRRTLMIQLEKEGVCIDSL